MKKWAVAVLSMAVAAALAFLLVTAPQRVDLDERAERSDPDRGQRLFWAGGCASCHAAAGARGDEELKLGGGLALVTPFGTFRAPNISPDAETGIGDWTGTDFANALLNGVSPSGRHYYPAFPYTSYARMSVGDVADLWAYMRTLPPVSRVNEPHDLPFPFNISRGIGLWKLLHLSPAPVVAVDESDARLALGRYLVEGPGHCGECHTPRDFSGGIDKARWLGGGPAPEGEGQVPNITPDPAGIGSWSEADIVFALETGLTPKYEAFGGAMVAVQRNMARLTPQDREAIAAYLKAVPPVASAR